MSQADFWLALIFLVALTFWAGFDHDGRPRF